MKSYSLKVEIQLDLEIDLNLVPMTLINILALNILKIYLYTKNGVGSSRQSKVIARNLKLTLRLGVTLTSTL